MINAGLICLSVRWTVGQGDAHGAVGNLFLDGLAQPGRDRLYFSHRPLGVEFQENFDENPAAGAP